jgi:hypothetical protein
MKGKDTFSKREINDLKRLIQQRCESSSSKQKSIRAKMRKIGFYGRDDFKIVNMTLDKFQHLIDHSKIKIKD